MRPPEPDPLPLCVDIINGWPLTSRKIIEKFAAYQLTFYLETNKLLSECQSGFRRGHSTETLLLHLLSDIYGAIDSHNLVTTRLLALFDISAAFKTVDYEILLERLEISFGLSGNFLSWVGSFFSALPLCGPWAL